MKIAQEEIFGPVLCGATVLRPGGVANRANRTFYGLSGRHLDPRREEGPLPGREGPHRQGTVWINCYNVLDPAAPFGGFKMSGIENGRELGQQGLEAYTELKTVTLGLDHN